MVGARTVAGTKAGLRTPLEGVVLPSDVDIAIEDGGAALSEHERITAFMLSFGREILLLSHGRADSRPLLALVATRPPARRDHENHARKTRGIGKGSLVGFRNW